MMPERSSTSITPELTQEAHKRKHSNGLDRADDIEKQRETFDSLARMIEDALKAKETNDDINLCGPAALDLLQSDPDVVLELAHEKLHAWPFREVPVCWRRLYEDASLHMAAQLMISRVDPTRKRRRMEGNCCKVDQTSSDVLSEVVEALDMGIALSGQPRRKDLFGTVLDALADMSEDSTFTHSNISVSPPAALKTTHPVPKVTAMAFEQFQQHLDSLNKPLIMSDVLDEWPALELWKDPKYLLKRTIGGRRLVPVEIGQSYTDDDWTQRIMPFKEYLQSYVLVEEPQEIGYLAQHDLISQVPALLKDIRTPDYCYTEPPPAPSMLPTKPAQLDEPQLNAWFGPQGTRSPLHNDPYYDILCQVLGYKYVRLYAPEETPNLYALGTDESGVNMANTSQLNLSFAERADTVDEFPALAHAAYQELILGPGECLFIPAGWWHFIESLTVSFSVSFWWN